MRILKLVIPHMHGDDVMAWQEFLASKGLYKGSAGGDFDETTERATLAYQKSGLQANGEVDRPTLEHAERDGFRPPLDQRQHYRTEGSVELSMEDRDVLKRIANEYYEKDRKGVDRHQRHGSAHSQAAAMYYNLYHRINVVHYRDQKAYKEIVGAYNDNRRSGESTAVDAMTRVIEAQVSRHEYISAQLRGRVVDVRTSDMSSDELRAFKDAAPHAGSDPIQETDHYHLQF